MSRRRLEDLPRVESGEVLFRLVGSHAYDFDGSAGVRVQNSALTKSEMTPTSTSYGPSVFVESLLPDGMASLEEACPAWRQKGYAAIPIEDLRAIGIDVRLSKEDCEFDSVRAAHGSLIGVTRTNRPSVVHLISQYLVRPPERKS